MHGACRAAAARRAPEQRSRGRRGAPAPGRPGLSRAGPRTAGCCQPRPRFPSFLPSSRQAAPRRGPATHKVRGGGANSGSLQPPSSPPAQVPAAPWHGSAAPSPRPRASPACPQSLPHATLAAPPQPQPRGTAAAAAAGPPSPAGRRGLRGAEPGLPLSRWSRRSRGALGALLVPSPGRGGAT